MTLDLRQVEAIRERIREARRTGTRLRPRVNRCFDGRATRILAIRCDLKLIQRIDSHTADYCPELQGNRSEFFRRAVEAQLDQAGSGRPVDQKTYKPRGL